MVNRGLRRRRGLLAIIPGIALFAACVGDAAAQEAQRAAGPLRFAAQSKDNVYFVVGPAEPSATPFAIWRWGYTKEAKGKVIAVAARAIVDCRANTQQVTRLEAYGIDGFLTQVPPNAAVSAKTTPKPGSVLDAIQQVSCRPSISLRTAKDYREGRVMADRLLGKSGGPALAAAPGPAPSAPAAKPAAAPVAGQPTPVQCKAAAAVMAASHEQSVKVGKLLLAMGPSNGVSSAELAKMRRTVADAEAKRDRALQVVRRYASAPTPDKAVIERLKDTRISDVDAQIERCMGATAQPPQAPVQKPGPKLAAVSPGPASPTKGGWMVATRGAGAADSFVEASQVDANGRFAIVYGCSVKTKQRYARIYTSEAFDDTASYAPSVPLKLSVDGRPAGEFSFRFQKMPHFARVHGARGRSLETIDVTTRADAKTLDRFMAAVRTANATIAVSFFDKVMQFASEPGSASLGKVDAQCPPA
ncbi:MAG: hypothetical protein AB7V13_11280 [Pseudorhodoplanes sp.]|uniref:hypothetical protein n=1 Tax=Pseudorhodoplanes sp. TaxID=1934341 RepID=UPI003D11ADBC